jgi:UDPglucose 6-dehydrogenase
MGYTIRFFGLGKLGLPLAALFASNGNRVIGIDNDALLIDALRTKKFASSEPELAALIATAGEDISFYEANETEKCDAAIIQVPTPSSSDAREFSTVYVEQATRSACRAAELHLRPGEAHLVIIASTLMPGAMEQVVEPIVRQFSERSQGRILLAYVPDLVAIGDVIRGFRRPPALLIGANDPQAEHAAADLYGTIVDPDVPTVTTNIREAELAKVAWNFFLCMKIEYANMIARMADEWGGMDADRILGCIGRDERIGSRFLKPGMPFGGPCFPRDVDAMMALCRRQKHDAGLAESVRRGNQLHAEHIVEALCQNNPKRVAVLGLSFKAGTIVTTDSPSFMIIARLLERGVEVVAFDRYREAIEGFSAMHWNGPVELAKDLEDACARADAILVAVDDEQFASVGQRAASDACIVDPWGRVKGPHPGLVRVGRHQ